MRQRRFTVTAAPMADRDSKANELELITDPEEKARVEARNAFLQTQAAMEMLPAWLQKDRPLLRPSLFTGLHRILLDRISAYPGIFRPGSVSITNSGHQPPPPGQVQGHMEALCDYVNEHWNSKSALHLAAYILWRTNWIHPFADGNGRTARIVSYLVLCAHTKTELPGVPTIPEQIAAAKQPYYSALEDADRQEIRGKINVAALEELLEACLARQLLAFFRTAGGRLEDLDEKTRAEIEQALTAATAEHATDRQANPVLPIHSRKKRGIVDQIENKSGFYSVILAVVGVLLTIIGWFYFR